MPPTDPPQGASSPDLGEDPLAWAAEHLPGMTDAAAFRAVERLAGGGVSPRALVPFLPRVAEGLRTGASSAAAEPAERSALMAYGGLEDPLLSFAADAAELVPGTYGATIAWMSPVGGLSGTHLLGRDPAPAEEIAADLREQRADRFAIVSSWLSPGPDVEIAVGCPTMRVDVVRRTDAGYAESDGPEAEAYVRRVMAALTGAPPSSFRSVPERRHAAG